MQIWKQEGLFLEYFTAQTRETLKHGMFTYLNSGWAEFNVDIRKKKGKQYYIMLLLILWVFSFLISALRGKNTELVSVCPRRPVLKNVVEIYFHNFFLNTFFTTSVNGKGTGQEKGNLCFKARWILLEKVI